MSKSQDKKSFIMYLDYEEQFNMLTDLELGKLIRAIIEYEKTKEIPKLDGIVKMAFSFIKGQLDRDREKYDEKCRKNRENGSKGGRPKKEIEEKATVNSETENNQTVNSETEGLNQKPKKPDNDNEDEVDNDNEDEVDNDNEDEVDNDNEDVVEVVENTDCINYYKQNISEIDPATATKLSFYLGKFDSNDANSIICEAINRAIDNAVKKPTYIYSILDDWINKKYKTLLDVKNEKKISKRTNKKYEFEYQSQYEGLEDIIYEN